VKQKISQRGDSVYIKTYSGNIYKVEDKGERFYVVGEMEVIRFDQVKIEVDAIEKLVDVWIVIDVENKVSCKSSVDWSYAEVLDLCFGEKARVYGMAYKMDSHSGLPKMYCVCHDENASGNLIFVEQHYFKTI
jgi:hypothetical protein